MITELLFILLFCVPLFCELYDDRHGDEHPNNDWVWRGLLMMFVSVAYAMYQPHEHFFASFGRAFVMSFGIFVLVFNYAINIIHKKPRWWDSLSDTAWPDRLDYWRLTPWYGRLLFMLIIFGVCAFIYFCPGKIVSYYNNCNC